MNVYKLTTEQKNLLIGQKWDDETYFNPILDVDGNWFISIEEVNGCNSIEWIHDLPLIPYNPIIVEMI
jgi:hypothetical protein